MNDAIIANLIDRIEALETQPRYGVIVGTSTWGGSNETIEYLKAHFPGVTFAVVPGATSVAFPLPVEDQ